jgi:hypothetical protein
LTPTNGTIVTKERGDTIAPILLIVIFPIFDKLDIFEQSHRIRAFGTFAHIALTITHATILLTGLGQHKLTAPQIHCNRNPTNDVAVEMHAEPHIRQNLYNRTLKVTTVIIGNDPTTDEARDTSIVEPISAVPRILHSSTLKVKLEVY